MPIMMKVNYLQNRNKSFNPKWLLISPGKIQSHCLKLLGAEWPAPDPSFPELISCFNHKPPCFFKASLQYLQVTWHLYWNAYISVIHPHAMVVVVVVDLFLLSVISIRRLCFINNRTLSIVLIAVSTLSFPFCFSFQFEKYRPIK